MGRKDALTIETEAEDVFAESFERGDVPFASTLTPQRREALREMAQAAMSEEREKISLRIPKSDLQRLKSRAMQEGVPYQTPINSLIHKYVTN
jgi:predicted DNA binding CopG/RHH family protein